MGKIYSPVHSSEDGEYCTNSVYGLSTIYLVTRADNLNGCELMGAWPGAINGYKQTGRTCSYVHGEFGGIFETWIFRVSPGRI